MPELRRDPVGGQWVILAPERALRPTDFKTDPVKPVQAESCPFCPGGESTTPPEIQALRDSGGPNQPGWRLRVFPNKFPVLKIEGDLNMRGDGMYDIMNGIGAHEVIVESPQHILSITSLPEERIGEVLWTYKARLRDLKRDNRLVYGLIFKNVGPRSGASLEHTHSQLIVMPVVPIRVQNEIDRCTEFHKFRGRCLFCDIIAFEINSGRSRVAMETANFIALEPYAARSPFETHILPKSHQSHYEDIDDSAIPELAGILRKSLQKIERALNNPSYNYLIHTGPLNVGPMGQYHWHFEIIPRISGVAGFEWGTGFFINPVTPENAAQYLRDIRL